MLRLYAHRHSTISNTDRDDFAQAFRDHAPIEGIAPTRAAGVRVRSLAGDTPQQFSKMTTIQKITESALISVTAKNTIGEQEQQFFVQTDIPVLRLMIAAESRQELAREKGQEFTEGAVPFFMSELVKAIGENQSQDEIEAKLYNLAMMAWVIDSVFHEVAAEEFVKSHLVFSFLLGGAVKYDRVSNRPSRPV